MTTGATNGDVDLHFYLSQVSHALAAELTVALAEVGLTPRAHCVLSRAMSGKLTQIQLADLCALDKTTMVVTVDGLEREGLAERRPSPTDRRARIIFVTKAGRRKVAEGQQIIRRTYDGVLATLPARERKAFVDGLLRLSNRRPAGPARPGAAVRRPRAARAQPS